MTLTEKQLIAREMMPKYRHFLLKGGSRSGKTVLLTRSCTVRALREEGSSHVIFRHRMNAARTSLWLDTIPFVLKSWWPDLKCKWYQKESFIAFPHESRLWIAGLDDKDRVEKILGQEHATLYFNECSQIKYANVVLALTRLAQKCKFIKNRAYYDINPVGKSHWTYKQFTEGMDPQTNRRLANAEDYGQYKINPRDNSHNLDADYIRNLETLSGKARQRFLEGEDQDDSEGQLWTVEMLEACRVDSAPPDLRRVVVAVDPSGARGDFDSRDAIGIVAAGLGVDGNAYVLADRTIRDRPEQWGKTVVNAYREFAADRVLGESNFGGDMVRSTIHAVDASIAFSATVSSKGKFLRAEPISALHEQGRVKFVGEFKELEDELQQFSQNGYMGEKSPNRADAFVFAITELLVKLGETPVYPMAFDKIACAPFPIPGEWLRIYCVAADRECDTLWCALDPDSDVLYFTNEYSSVDPNPVIHAAMIKRVAKDWDMPGLLSTGAKNPDELRAIWSQYKAEGVRLSQVVEADNSVQAVWARITTGRLRAFNTLTRFQQQYERYHRKRTETAGGETNVIVEREDGLMLAARAICAVGRSVMRSKPGAGEDAESKPALVGSWMG